MKKILSVFMLALLLFVVSGCTKEKEKERTYMADGVYMTWELSSTDATLLMPDGTNYTDPEGKTKSVKTPVLSTVKVYIYNDKVVKYEIDELQSKPYISTARGSSTPNIDENGYVTGVTWKWNEMTKRELEYGYNMENASPQGEWYIQAINLENYWLENGEPVDDEALTSVTIHYDVYTKLAKQALENAKEGIIGAITDKEHYTYDVTYVTAKVDKNGKISNVAIDAHLFGNTNANTYNKDSNQYLVFGWNPQTKYESYGEMTGGKKWQDQIDTLVDYINENGWTGNIVSGNGTDATKGLNIANKPVTALSTVTIQTYREVLVLNKLREFFPFGWAE
jgi:hypothetical protein